MATAALGDVSSAVLQAGSLIRDLIDRGYKASQDLKTFELRLERLDNEKAMWEDEIKKHGLSDDAQLIRLFDKAASEVESEAARLRDKKVQIDESCCGGCWLKFKMASFPSELEQTIARVSNIFDNVLNDLKRTTEIRGAFQKRAITGNSPLSFRADRRYIRLEETEDKVLAELRSSDRPTLVLLHGFSGSGKTSLARSVALQIESPVIDEVIYLECGPRVNLQAKQLELREKLGWNSAKLGSNEGDEEGSGRSESDRMITTSLCKLLKERSLLIVLDDVWKPSSDTNLPNFLQNMINLGGSNVKWLITSQAKDVCERLNLSSLKFVSIKMENISLDIARKILAVHIGFERTDIPSETESSMDSILRKVDKNPLAITCVAPAICIRFEDMQVWEEATRHVSDLLGSKARTSIHSKEYGRSFWEAIEVGFDLLSKLGRNLLVLMSMCKGPSIPEEIIRFLFEHSRESTHYHNFLESLAELENRQLIKVAITTDRWDRKTMRWSVHDLIKAFIVRKCLEVHSNSKDNEVSRIERLSRIGITLFRTDTKVESQVINVLAALYLDDELQNEFAERSSLQVNMSFLSRNVGRRDIIEPISCLLVLQESENWSSNLSYSAQQLCKRWTISSRKLLRPPAFLPDSFKMKLMDVRGMLEGLVKAVSIQDHHMLSKCAAFLFQILSSNAHAAVKIVSCPGAIEGLLSGLGRNADQELQKLCAASFRNLARANQVDNIAFRLASVSGLLEELVKAFFHGEHHDLRAEVVGALANLARDNDSFKIRLMDVRGMLGGVVKALTMQNHDLLPRRAAVLFQILSSNAHAAVKIVSCPDAIEGLLNGLGRDTDSVLQEHCAATLGNLAGGDDNIKGVMVDVRGLQEALVDTVRKDDNDGWAIRALTYLNPQRGKEMQLDSAMAYSRRGEAERDLGFYKEALEDLDEALCLDPLNGNAFIVRCYVKTKLSDLEGALADADIAVQIKRTQYVLQERGVLKRMMNDLPGALADLDESLGLSSDDYEVLKHRGFVKFFSGDENGARADAEMAIKCKPLRVDDRKYGNGFLGGSSVEYLNFQLR